MWRTSPIGKTTGESQLRQMPSRPEMQRVSKRHSLGKVRRYLVQLIPVTLVLSHVSKASLEPSRGAIVVDRLCDGDKGRPHTGCYVVKGSNREVRESNIEAAANSVRGSTAAS